MFLMFRVCLFMFEYFSNKNSCCRREMASTSYQIGPSLPMRSLLSSFLFSARVVFAVICPSVDKPDLVVSLGTDTQEMASHSHALSSQGQLHDGFVPRLWRSFMSSLDGQLPWTELLNRLDITDRQKYMRLNVPLSDVRFTMFDVNGIKGLQEIVQIEVQNSQACKHIAFALLIASLYFEFCETPQLIHGKYQCHGILLSSLPGNMLDDALHSVGVPTFAFAIHGRMLANYNSVTDICSVCHRFGKHIDFWSSSLTDMVNISVQSKTFGRRTISACPQTVEWFLSQQQLDAGFGRADHDRGLHPICKVCHPHSMIRRTPALGKRKRVDLENEDGYKSKRRCLRGSSCWIVWGYFHSLQNSGTAQGAEVDYVIFRLLISDEPAQALSSRRNSEILISVHKSLLINDRWKERKRDKTYENFENKRSI